MNNSKTRAPKLIGDFGEGLVTYTLIRKDYEVAYVDHVGADLICEKDGNRIAVSVKTRLFRPDSKESRMFCIEDSHLEKLRYFSNKFALEPVFALLVCLSDKSEMHLIMIKVADIPKVFHKIKHGYSVLFAEKHISNLKNNNFIDYSYWGNEIIGNKHFV